MDSAVDMAQENIALKQRNRELAAEVERLRGALGFYAHSEWNDHYPGGIAYSEKGKVVLDTGQIARAALECGRDKTTQPRTNSSAGSTETSGIS